MVDKRTGQSLLHDHCWPSSAAVPVPQSLSRQPHRLRPGAEKQQKRGGIQQMVKMTEASKCHSSKGTAIHCLQNSTICGILSCGIWPTGPKPRKRPLAAPGGGLPVSWLWGWHPLAGRPKFRQPKPGAGVFSGPPKHLAGGCRATKASWAAGLASGGFTAWRAGHEGHINTKAAIACSQRRKYDSFGSLANAS